MKHGTPCIACGVQDVAEAGVLRICRGCGLAMTASLAGVPHPDDFYSRDYFTERGGHGHLFTSEFWTLHDAHRFTKELDLIERFIPRGRVLDIGCALGNFLWHAQRRGWQVYGHDISVFAAEYARRRLGATVLSGPLTPGQFGRHAFDLITLHHVIEHVDDPRTFLEESVFALLKAEGLVLIEVPNLASLEFRAVGERWEDLRLDQHLWHFTPQALEQLVVRAGGRRVFLTTLGHSLWHGSILIDYPKMVLAVMLGLPYRGKVGVWQGNATGSDDPGENVEFTHSLAHKVTGIIGAPFMTVLNRLMLGKRLVMIAGRSGA